MKTLIITADDFGARESVNRAVEMAHTGGILTSASLMVNEPFASMAVRIAHHHPALSVGLHLVVNDGLRAPCGEAQRPFPRSPVRAGLLIGFSRRARKQALQEIEAQFERFRTSGLRLSHLDGHHHMHLHPLLFPRVVSLALEHGACRIRIPCEPLARDASAARKVEWLIFQALGRRYRRMLRGTALTAPHHVYGHLATGRMDESRLLRILAALPDGESEVFLHPELTSSGPNAELSALLSPRARRAVDSLHARPEWSA